MSPKIPITFSHTLAHAYILNRVCSIAFIHDLKCWINNNKNRRLQIQEICTDYILKVSKWPTTKKKQNQSLANHCHTYEIVEWKKTKNRTDTVWTQEVANVTYNASISTRLCVTVRNDINNLLKIVTNDFN